MFKLKRQSSLGRLGRAKQEFRDRSSTDSSQKRDGSGRGKSRQTSVSHAGVNQSSSPSPARHSMAPTTRAATPSPPTSAPPKERLFAGRKFGSISVSPSARKSFSIFSKKRSSANSNKSASSKPLESYAEDDQFDDNVKTTPSKFSSKASRFSLKPAYFSAPAEKSSRKLGSSGHTHSAHSRASGLSFVPNLAEEEPFELDPDSLEVFEKPKGRSKKRTGRRRPPPSAPDLSPYGSPGVPHTSDATTPTSSRPTLVPSQSMRTPSPYSMNKDSSMSRSMRHSMRHIMRSESPYHSQSNLSASSSTPIRNTPMRSRRQQRLDDERDHAPLFQIGQLVMLHSLQNETMNGRKGRVYGKKQESDRYHIALFALDSIITKETAPPLEEEDDYVAIRPRNLRLITWEEAAAVEEEPEENFAIPEEEEKIRDNENENIEKHPAKKKIGKKKKKSIIEQESVAEEAATEDVPKAASKKKKKKLKKEKEPSVAHHNRSTLDDSEEVYDDHYSASDGSLSLKGDKRAVSPTRLSGYSVNSSKVPTIPVSDFVVGEHVRLQNLKTEDMNGREGYVYGMSEDRVHVVIDQVGDIDSHLRNFMQDRDYVSIRPRNLLHLSHKKMMILNDDGAGTHKADRVVPMSNIQSDSDWGSSDDEVAADDLGESKVGMYSVQTESSDWGPSESTYDGDTKESISVARPASNGLATTPSVDSDWRSPKSEREEDTTDDGSMDAETESDEDTTDDDLGGANKRTSVSRPPPKRNFTTPSVDSDWISSDGEADSTDDDDLITEDTDMKSFDDDDDDDIDKQAIQTPNGTQSSDDYSWEEDDESSDDSSSPYEVSSDDMTIEETSYAEANTDKASVGKESIDMASSGEESLSLGMIAEKSDCSDPKIKPPTSYKKKNSFNKDTDETSTTAEDDIEEEEIDHEESDYEEKSSDDDKVALDDLKNHKTLKTNENEQSQVLDWYHCSRMLNIEMSDEEKDSEAENDSQDLASEMQSSGGDSEESGSLQPQKRRKSKSKMAEASSVKRNHLSLTSAIDNVKSALQYEEMLRDLKKKGLSREIICTNPEDDDCSEMSMTDHSYVMDLTSQMHQRHALRQEELLEMAFDLFQHLGKGGKVDGQSEELFLQIHQQVTEKHGPELEARDDAKDRRLKHYLAAVKHNKY